MTDVAYAAPAISSLFPARVTRPDGSVLDKVRAVLTPDLLVVYGEQDRRVRTLFKASIVEMHPDVSSHDGWVATDAEGGDWVLRRGSGCGCGSPLRHMPSPPPVDL